MATIVVDHSTERAKAPETAASCGKHGRGSDALPLPEVRVNGKPIPREAIAAEVQNFPAETPGAAFEEATRALVIREVLAQEAARLGIVPEPHTDADGRMETDEDAVIRALIEREVAVPQADDESLRRYYDNNVRRFAVDGGEPLPFERVRDRIAAYLTERVMRRASAQYVGLLLGRAEITGIAFGDGKSPLVQ